MADFPKPVEANTIKGGEPESVLKNHSRTITWEFDLDEAIKKAAAEHLTELQKQPVTPEEAQRLGQRLIATPRLTFPGGVGEPRVQIQSGIFVSKSDHDRETPVTVCSYGHGGKSVTVWLTPAEARHVAALLLAAAGSEG